MPINKFEFPHSKCSGNVLMMYPLISIYVPHYILLVSINYIHDVVHPTQKLAVII